MDQKGNTEICFEATFNHTRNCISVAAGGRADITFMTDASQLASVFPFVSELEDCHLLITIKKIAGSFPKEKYGKQRSGGKNRKSTTYR